MKKQEKFEACLKDWTTWFSFGKNLESFTCESEPLSEQSHLIPTALEFPLPQPGHGNYTYPDQGIIHRVMCKGRACIIWVIDQSSNQVEMGLVYLIYHQKAAKRRVTLKRVATNCDQNRLQQTRNWSKPILFLIKLIFWRRGLGKWLNANIFFYKYNISFNAFLSCNNH